MKVRSWFPQRKVRILLPKDTEYVWDDKKTISRCPYDGTATASKQFYATM